MRDMRHIVGIIGSCAVLWGCAAADNGGPSATPRTKAPKGATTRVGVILPLSGDEAIYGRAFLHGIECGAGGKTPCASRAPIELITRDIAGTPAKSVAAVQDLVQNSHVAAIIGPIATDHAVEASRAAQAANVPLISLSPSAKVTQIGEYIYRVGANPAHIVQAVAQYAVKEKGLKTFAILYPHNHYGEVNRDIFRDAVTAAGGQITQEKAYSANLGQIVEARERAVLAPKPVTTTATGESAEAPAEGEGAPPAPPALPKLTAVQGVDAVFIPDSPRAIAAMGKAYGAHVLGGAILIGTNRLNSLDILSAGKMAEGAIFGDGFFKDSANVDTQQFVSTILQAYSVEPTRLEAEGYDAMSVVAEAARHGGRNAQEMQRVLQRMRKFTGITGKMQFTSDGDVAKNITILTINGGQIQELGTRAVK